MAGHTLEGANSCGCMLADHWVSENNSTIALVCAMWDVEQGLLDEQDRRNKQQQQLSCVCHRPVHQTSRTDCSELPASYRCILVRKDSC